MSFKKIYELTIGKPLIVSSLNRENLGVGALNLLAQQEGVLADGSFVEKVDLDDYVSANENVTRILSNNQITFNIDKSTKPPNNATVTIYNMSEELSGYLASNQSNNIVVLLKAGYADTTLDTLFKGTLTFFEESFTTENKVTKLRLSDGGVNL